MSIDPGVSIVISFLGFAWIFWKKIYPMVVGQIDTYIDSVKNRIQKSEDLKDEAYNSLKAAYVKKDDTVKIIALNRQRSKEKIQKLRQENEKYLKTLRDRHESSLNARLNSEFLYQKNQLIKRLSDSVVDELSKEMSDGECKVVFSASKDDLFKLLGKHG